jgi:hypothetical protein
MPRLLCCLLVVLAAAPLPAPAQLPTDSIRTAALRDYHGPDLEGKDGPLAKAGRSLLLLYHEYEAFRARCPDSSFTATVSSLPTQNGRVAVEAVAVDSADTLLADLEALGLEDGLTGGRVVSGWLPIEQIPAMARLESLRGLIQSERRR